MSLPYPLSLSVLLLLSAPLSCLAGTIQIIADSDSPYQSFAAQLQQRLAAEQRITPPNSATLCITVGPDALTDTLQQPEQTPLLATLVTRHEFLQASRNHHRPRQISAIFREQPLARLITLSHLATPTIQRIALLYSSERPPPPPLRSPALLYQQTDDLRATLNTLLPQVDALVTLHDPELYNAESFKSLLLSSYRQQKPLICHTLAMVTAGCIMGVHSSVEQLQEETMNWIGEFRHNHRHATLPRARYSSLFTVATNPMVARSLGFELPHATQLTRLLQAQEQSP